ncbi:TetR/AcrR family transcriptional regulator [Candidatus Bipolaricaulota bacterium]|nr:TetR/AcrR family transcriptional regulator [Candidatus Bipolaricaulota bacterium]
MTEDSSKGKSTLIREAATRVISHQGYFQTSIQEIAKEAGISVGTIYNYFENKQEILLDIFSKEFEDRKEFYEELSRQDTPLVEGIQAILNRHFSQLESHKELLRVIVQERFKPGSKLGKQLNQQYREVIRYVENLVKRALENGQIRSCDPKVVATALFGAVESIVAYGVLRGEEEQEELFARAPEELANFFWWGLRIENIREGSK